MSDTEWRHLYDKENISFHPFGSLHGAPCLLPRHTDFLKRLFHLFKEIPVENPVKLCLDRRGGRGYRISENLENGEYRLTLIDTDGTVLYDTNADAATMENHSDRREFQEAFLSGYGESHRYSRTLTEQTYYFAKKLSDDRVLRISTSQVTIVSLLLGMLQPLLVITFLAILLSVFLAKRASRNLVRPLNNLDLNDPLSNDVYEELSPLLRHMAQQNKQIALQMDELSRSQNEFNAITSNMSEGLIVLNKDGVVVSLNTAARKIFEAEEDSIGKDFLTIDRTPEISRAIKETLSGKKQELEYEKNGRNYDLCINKIVEKDEVIGVLLLAIDNTEKFRRSRTAESLPPMFPMS